MKVQLCGVRGSTPAPGAPFVRVGGHTSCVAISTDGAARPRLLLDAGTGIRAVAALLDGDAFEGTIALTHLHWDHVQGLPFFGAADRDDARVTLLLPDDGVDAATSLARGMSPPHFPIGPDGLRGRWTFEAIDIGRHQIEGMAVTAIEVPHKGGRTFAYRIDDGRGSLGYVPDHLPSRPIAQSPLVDALRGVDVLLHDAQFVAGEEAIALDYGHSTIDAAIDVASHADVGRLVLFHHAPQRTDDDLDAVMSALPTTPFPVDLAVEGATYHPGVRAPATATPA